MLANVPYYIPLKLIDGLKALLNNIFTLKNLSYMSQCL